MDQIALLEQPDASSNKPKIAGMGPIVLDKGVAFRVWAPNANRVSVIGNFNDWKADAHPLRREESGCWFAIVEHAKSGDEYKYEITNGDNIFQRIDPRVREVTNSVGNGIIHDPNFDWQGDDFKCLPGMSWLSMKRT